MKKSVSYYLIFLLLIISCKKENESVTIITEEKRIIETSEYPCIDSDYIMYKETATMWEKSWAGVFTNPQENASISPVLQFSNDSINKLLDKFTGREPIGVRIYYILLEDKDIVPSLAMVNLESCKKDQTCDDCVLISTIYGEEEFISSKEADTLRGFWEDASDTYPDHTPVYGYNYGYEKIKELMNSSENAVSNPSEAAINIKYGLHTLGPLDTELFTDPNSPSTDLNVTGSIVYANIIYANTINTDNAQRNSADPEFDFDFAMPCPAYCSGNGSE
ncbi:hypothetical protein [Dokdonia sp.]|uniref:hypothetical protein n=1 Tax=Dokdonia sp. TaxID=2024995 RepID=UPI003263D493